MGIVHTLEIDDGRRNTYYRYRLAIDYVLSINKVLVLFFNICSHYILTIILSIKA